MTAAGLRAFEARNPARSGAASYERKEAAELTPDEAHRLRSDAAASAYFEAQPPWYRRTALHWVVSAKQPATRARRLATLIEDCAAGRPIKPLDRRPKSAT